MLEYAEDIQRGHLKTDVITKIKIDELLSFENISFELASIIYFQGMHYTTHIKGINHPKFLPVRDERWFYHDGFKPGFIDGSFTKGLLFENNPKLEIDVSTDQLKPYILIYKVI